MSRLGDMLEGKECLFCISSRHIAAKQKCQLGHASYSPLFGMLGPIVLDSRSYLDDHTDVG